jgi:ATP-dependent DNA helicase PIF1
VHEILHRGRRIVDNQGLADQIRASFNADQLQAFNTIVSAIIDNPQTAHFYLQGPGGTRKTFLYKALCYYYRAQGKTILCVASTGITGLLLPDGRISHSQFRIPLDLTASSICSVTKQSQIRKLLAKANLIIWDEVPMQHKFYFTAVYRLFIDIRSIKGLNKPLFSGVLVIFRGDFAQILPVVVNGSQT